MSLVNQIAAQATQSNPGAEGSITHGLDAGIKLAQARDQASRMDEALQLQRQEFDLKKSDYIFDPLKKASDATDPKMKKIFLNLASNRAKQMGLSEFNQDTINMAMTEGGSKTLGDITSAIHGMRMGDQEAYKQAVNDLINGGFVKDPAEAVAMVSKIMGDVESHKNKQAEHYFQSENLKTRNAELESQTGQKYYKNLNDLMNRSKSGQVGKLYEKYAQNKNISENLKRFIADPSAYGDTASLLQSAKAFQLDASVVREPEMKAIMKAGGWSNYVQNAVDSALGSGRLQPAQRETMLKVLNQMEGNSKKQWIESARPIYEQAKSEINKKGLPLDENMKKVFNPSEAPEFFSQGSAQAASGEIGAPVTAPKTKRQIIAESSSLEDALTKLKAYGKTTNKEEFNLVKGL